MHFWDLFTCERTYMIHWVGRMGPDLTHARLYFTVSTSCTLNFVSFATNLNHPYFLLLTSSSHLCWKDDVVCVIHCIHGVCCKLSVWGLTVTATGKDLTTKRSWTALFQCLSSIATRQMKVSAGPGAATQPHSTSYLHSPARLHGLTRCVQTFDSIRRTPGRRMD